ncbi:MAG: DUF2157 domain-containing protein [bacterium]
MQENKHIAWLLSQLSTLVQNQVISPETAESIDEHYRTILSSRPQSNRFSLVFAIIGTILIGGGIILFLTRLNLSQPYRAALAFVPLLAAQALTLHVVKNKQDSRPWHEAAAIVHTLMIGVCLDMVEQAYHLPISESSLLLTWLILTLPLSWLMQSVSIQVMLHIGAVSWFFQAQDSVSRNLIFLLLALFLTPAVIRIPRLSVPCSGHIVTRWSAALSLVAIIPNMLLRDIGLTRLICFSLLFSIYPSLETTRFSRQKSLVEKPFFIIGNSGICIILFLCTYPGILTEFVLPRESFNDLIIIFALLALGIIMPVVRRQNLNLVGWMSSLSGPLTFTAALIASKTSSKSIFFWFFSAWLAAWSLAIMAAGFKERRLAVVNIGVSILLIHIFIQFMRTDIGALSRSLVFIVLGVLFLSLNRAFLRRRRLSS